MKSNVKVGEYLLSRMEYTKYVSTRGARRNISLLYKDFMKYYKGVLDERIFDRRWQIQTLLSDRTVNIYGTYLLAMFLNVSVDDLSDMKLPKKTQEQIFDEEIERLRGNGLNDTQISRQLGVSPSAIWNIKEDRYSKGNNSSLSLNSKPKSKTKNWNKLDREKLPLVRNTIKKLYGDENIKPQKITMHSIEKEIGVTRYQMKNMPESKWEAERYCETQEQFWARKIVWAVGIILKEGQPFNLRHIWLLTNFTRETISRCAPYLRNFCDDDLAARIIALVE